MDLGKNNLIDSPLVSLSNDAQDLLDDTHPVNDAYLKQIIRLQQRAASFANAMRPSEARAIRAEHEGLTPTQAKQKLGVKNKLRKRIVQTPEGRQLLEMLNLIAITMAGPEEAQRRDMLWRIAVSNEDVAPRVSVSAIESINKMHEHREKIDNGITDGTINIQINNETLGRGPLDQ